MRSGQIVNLCLEIMRRAIDDIISGMFPSTGEVSQETLEAFESAKYWFYQQDEDEPDYQFSLRWICSILGVEKREVIQRLKQKINEKNFEIVLRSKGLLNGEVAKISRMQSIAKQYLESEFSKFGQEIEVNISERLEVSCEPAGREMLCKTLLPGLK